MRLWYTIVGLGAAVVVAALAVGIVYATRSPSDTTARPIRVGALLTPRTPLFGDTVTAQVEFAGDTRRIVPGSVHVESTFSPFRKVARPRLVRKLAGDAEYVVWTASLRCLDRRCLPGQAHKRVTFPRARVTYTLRKSTPGASDVTRSLTVPWPSLVVYSRVDPIEVQATDPRGEPPWRADIASLLDVTYRAPATVTAAVAFGVAALLGLGAILLVAPLRRREDGEAPTLALDPVTVPQTPLELALAQLEHPSADADPESTRRALELVAQELSQREQTDLQTGAQRLAWSAGAPESEAARELAARARHALERGDGADG